MNTNRTLTDTTVGDLMTPDPVRIQSTAPLAKAAHLLDQHHIHGLPVVDDSGALVGVVSQTDLVNWHYNAGIDGASFYDTSDRVPDKEGRAGLRLADIRTALVEEVMSPVVHCVGMERPIAAAAATMIRHRIHRLIVVDDEMRVQGILSAVDLLQAVPGVDRLVAAPRRAQRPHRSPPSADA